MFDMTGFYIIIGIGLLFSALIAALKIGLWVWVATRIFGRPVQQYQDEPVARPGSAANGIKKWLTIIATVLGIVSTTVGLLEKCEDDPEPQPVRYIQPVRHYQTGTRCCTPQATCMMMAPAQVGSVCTCVGAFGMFQGTVCK